MKQILAIVLVLSIYISGCNNENQLSQKEAEQLATEVLEKRYEEYVTNGEKQEDFENIEVLRTIRDKKDKGWFIYFTSSKADPILKEIAIITVTDKGEITNETWLGY